MENTQEPRYELHEVTDDDGAGNYDINPLAVDLESPCSDPSNYVVQFNDAGDTIEVEANKAGEMIVNGKVVAVWKEA